MHKSVGIQWNYAGMMRRIKAKDEGVVEGAMLGKETFEHTPIDEVPFVVDVYSSITGESHPFVSAILTDYAGRRWRRIWSAALAEASQVRKWQGPPAKCGEATSADTATRSRRR